MSILLGEAEDLGLHGRAVPRPGDLLEYVPVQVHVFPDDGVHPAIGVSQVAAELVLCFEPDTLVEEGKGSGRVIAVVLLG